MNPYWEQAKKVIANKTPITAFPEFLPEIRITHYFKKEHDIRDYEFRNVRGHVEVYKNGTFKYSADTDQEARDIFYNELF